MPSLTSLASQRRVAPPPKAMLQLDALCWFDITLAGERQSVFQSLSLWQASRQSRLLASYTYRAYQSPL